MPNGQFVSNGRIAAILKNDSVVLEGVEDRGGFVLYSRGSRIYGLDIKPQGVNMRSPTLEALPLRAGGSINLNDLEKALNLCLLVI